MGSPPKPRLPFGPLGDALGTVWYRRPRNKLVTRFGCGDPLGNDWEPIDGVPITALSELTGFNRRTLTRWVHEGVPVEDADQIAISLGLHPASIWSDWFPDDPLTTYTTSDA